MKHADAPGNDFAPAPSEAVAPASLADQTKLVTMTDNDKATRFDLAGAADDEVIEAAELQSFSPEGRRDETVSPSWRGLLPIRHRRSLANILRTATLSKRTCSAAKCGGAFWKVRSTMLPKVSVNKYYAGDFPNPVLKAQRSRWKCLHPARQKHSNVGTQNLGTVRRIHGWVDGQPARSRCHPTLPARRTVSVDAVF